MTKPKRQTRRLPANLERAIAVASDTDPRTVANVLAGRPARFSTRDRVLAAIETGAFNERIADFQQANAKAGAKKGGR